MASNKAQIIRDDIEVNMREVPADSELRECIVFRDTLRNGRVQPVPYWKKGTVILHAKAHRLVQMGVAIPADEECAKNANRSEQQQKAAQHAYERLNAGIHPDDFGLYDALIITGYNPDGSYKQGPNWHLYEKSQGPLAPTEDEEDE